MNEQEKEKILQALSDLNDSHREFIKARLRLKEMKEAIVESFELTNCDGDLLTEYSEIIDELKIKFTDVYLRGE